MEENNKKLPKRNIVLYLSVVVILISLTFRASYAYFVATVTNTTTPTQTVINSGDLKLKFVDGYTFINAQDMNLSTAEEALSASNNYSSFSVTNTGNITGNYKLYLSKYSITENLINADFKWRLKINDTIYTGNFYDLFNGKTATNGVVASNSDDIAIISTPISLTSGGTDNCEFRIWLEETDQNQIGLTEGAFSTTIRLIATT